MLACGTINFYSIFRFEKYYSRIEKLKWGGYTETFKIPDVKSLRVSFIEDIVSPLMLKPIRSVDDWEEIMDQLIALAVERDLYNQRKLQIYKKHIEEQNYLLSR